MQFSETLKPFARSIGTSFARGFGTLIGVGKAGSAGQARAAGQARDAGRAGGVAAPAFAAPAFAGRAFAHRAGASPAYGALAFAGALLAVVSLAACTPDPDEQAPQCPLRYLRPDAATLSRYDGHGTDLTNLVLSGRLQNIQGACKGLLGHQKLTAHAHVEMVLTRGPAANGREFDVPYIVAVTKKGQVLQKQELIQHVVFPPNVDTVQVTGEDVNMAFPTDRGLTGPNYTIYFLFELTPAELSANQRALGVK